MKSIPKVWIVFLMLPALQSVSQTDSTDLLERTIEYLSETSSDPVDLSDLAEPFFQRKDSPVNLNRAGSVDLDQLPFLNETQKKNLANYLQTYGTIYSLYELMAVNGFDSVTIGRLRPYICVGPEAEQHPLRPGTVFRSGRSQLLIRYEQVLQKQAGYRVPDSILAADPDAGYAGSPMKLMFRYTWSYFDRLSVGISGEKDPGEMFFRGSQSSGMDFYSGFLSLRNTGILRQLTIGNFNADFGQGLTVSSGITSGSIPGTGNLRRYASGIRPSQSLNEGEYLRGIALVLKKGGFRLSGFYSHHRRDVKPIPDTIEAAFSRFSSFNETGYHRMPRETAGKNLLKETLIGGNLTFRNTFLSLGITGISSHWSASLDPESRPYSAFSFRGKKNLNLGIDYQFLWKELYLFGEVSRSLNGGMGFLAGFNVNADPQFLFSLTARNYQRHYQNLLSNAIGQNSININEQGILLAVSSAVAPRLGLSGHIDVFRFPWLKYRNDNASAGKEIQARGDLGCGKNIDLYLRFRYRSGQINDPEAIRRINIPAESRSLSIRFQSTWRIFSSAVVKSRFEWIQNRRDEVKPCDGYLISQELIWKLLPGRLSLNFLYGLFHTDTYNERIYAYESDVPCGYSVPAYSGRGLRWMIMAGWSPTRFLDLWVRYSGTWYADRNVIGSGLEQINGNTKSEAEIQCRLRF